MDQVKTILNLNMLSQPEIIELVKNYQKDNYLVIMLNLVKKITMFTP